jgi:hypothetical protein
MTTVTYRVIHDSMVEFIAVADSPYFVKTTDSGIAALNLPASPE